MWQWWLIFYDLPSILWATLVSDSAVCAIQCRSGIFATIFLQQGIGWSDSQKQANSTAFVEGSERAKNMHCHKCKRFTSGKCITPIHLGSFREMYSSELAFQILDPSKRDVVQKLTQVWPARLSPAELLAVPISSRGSFGTCIRDLSLFSRVRIPRPQVTVHFVQSCTSGWFRLERILPGSTSLSCVHVNGAKSLQRWTE